LFLYLKLVADLAQPSCSALPEPHSKYSAAWNSRKYESLSKHQSVIFNIITHNAILMIEGKD
ncbi:hypothetical protein Q4R94_23130, partial [Morganella morganii]